MRVRFDFLASAFAAVALVFSGCSENPDDPTPPPPAGDGVNYTVSVSGVTPDAALVSVVPVDKSKRYWIDVIEASEYTTGCSGKKENVATYLPTLMAKYAEAEGKTITELLSLYGKTGDANRTFDLKAETDYVAFAVGVDNAGKGTDVAVVATFKTLKAEPIYAVTISDITATTATINVVPKNKTEVYFIDYMAKADYESLCGGEPGGLATYLPDMFAYLSEAVEMTIPEIVGILSSTGDDSSDIDELDPDTEYIAYAVGVDNQGNTTNLAVVETFRTLVAAGDPPTVTATLTPGDADGLAPESNLTAVFKSSDITSAKYGMFANAQVQAVIAQGKDYDYIMENYGNAMTAAELTALNGADGRKITFIELDPETEYCAIIKVTNAAGLSTVEHVEESTASAGEPTEAYSAWLGTWTITSTTSAVNKAPVSFDVVVAPKVTNSTYKVTGWGISVVRNETTLPITLKFDSSTGGFGILNDQLLQRDDTPGDSGDLAFACRVYNGAGFAAVSGSNFDPLTATIGADKTSGSIVCNSVVINATTYNVAYMDYVFWGDDDKVYGFNTDPAFTKNDHPLGPFTMTKKSAAPASQVASRVPMQIRDFVRLQAGAKISTTGSVRNGAVKAGVSNASKIDKNQAVNEASIRQVLRTRK